MGGIAGLLKTGKDAEMAEALEPYEVYAVKYAQRDAVRADHFIFSDAHDVPMPMDYFLWAIVGRNRTFVVDTGFCPEEAVKRGRDHVRSPAEALRHIGVNAETAEEVILTHMHYDHCGNLEQFPKAKFYLQDREMAFATGRYMREDVLRRSFAVQYVTELVRALYDDRVDFVDGVREIAPGISLHHVGGHTDGLQVVRVWTQRGWMVLASDATHFYDNINRTNPFPVVFNVGHMLEAYRTLAALADGPENIIPGHDPLVMQRFPAASKETEGVAVRLDNGPIHWE